LNLEKAFDTHIAWYQACHHYDQGRGE